MQLALDVTANCICELHCFALDGFDLNTVHKLSSKEKKSWRSQNSNPCSWVGSKNAFSVLRSPYVCYAIDYDDDLILLQVEQKLTDLSEKTSQNLQTALAATAKNANSLQRKAKKSVDQVLPLISKSVSSEVGHLIHFATFIKANTLCLVCLAFIII